MKCPIPPMSSEQPSFAPLGTAPLVPEIENPAPAQLELPGLLTADQTKRIATRRLTEL
jgi:hypothetical protein